MIEILSALLDHILLLFDCGNTLVQLHVFVVFTYYL